MASHLRATARALRLLGHVLQGMGTVAWRFPRLSSLERDLLKDTLSAVKRFKALLHQRLRLDAV